MTFYSFSQRSGYSLLQSPTVHMALVETMIQPFPEVSSPTSLCCMLGIYMRRGSSCFNTIINQGKAQLECSVEISKQHEYVTTKQCFSHLYWKLQPEEPTDAQYQPIITVHIKLLFLCIVHCSGHPIPLSWSKH